MPIRQLRPRTHAFTLIELLVVVFIIAVLIALLIPAVQAAREAARRARCLSNLKQIGIATHGYHDLFNVFPPGISVDVGGTSPGWGWAFNLLPSLEQRTAYDSANLMTPLFDAKNQTVVLVRLSAFVCPSGGGDRPFEYGFFGTSIRGMEPPAPSQYVASSGWLRVGKEVSPGLMGLDGEGNGVFYRNSRTTTADITDGLGQTLFVGERSRNVADATWAGVQSAVVPFCTKASWPTQVCESALFMVLGRTGGPAPDLIRIGSATTAYTPNARNIGPDGFCSLHPGLSDFLFGDGSVRAIKSSVAGPVFSALGSRSNGEVVSSTDF